jgi:alpha-methylacyl-CoA racemase
MMLSDFGAEVIRVDRVETPAKPHSEVDRSYLRGRRSIGIDLAQPEGAELVLDLVTTADVLLEGFRPNVMERLGLGPEPCLRRNPSLVYGRMTGFGQEGPLAGTAGHDITYIALAGVLAHIGPKERPLPPINLVGDFGGGSMFLIAGVLAALLRVKNGAAGQVVDAAMTDGAAMLLTPIHDSVRRGAWAVGREENFLDGGAPWYSVYETGDGKHVAVGALEPPFYARLLQGLGLEEAELPGQWERERWPELREHFSRVFRQRTREEWENQFDGLDACFAPVLTMDEAPHHPHNMARRAFRDINGFADQPSPAPRFSASDLAPGRPYAAGGDTDDVLRELGRGVGDLAKLRAAKVIG